MTSPAHEPCILDGGRCSSYAPGHNVHWIQAKLIGRAPWGWRDCLVVAVDGLTLRLRYVEEDVEFTAWHHEDLSKWLSVGAPVRINQDKGTLMHGPFGQVYIAHDSPLAAVPTPEHPDLWAAEITLGVVDLATGRGVNTELLDEPE